MKGYGRDMFASIFGKWQRDLTPNNTGREDRLLLSRKLEYRIDLAILEAWLFNSIIVAFSESFQGMGTENKKHTMNS